MKLHILLIAICSATLTLMARPMDRTRTWDELGTTIERRGVSLVLPDQTRLSGVAIGIENNLLILNVRRTSNSRLYPKGLTMIPREQVSTIEMYLPRNRNPDSGSTIGAALGGVAMSPVALAIGDGESAPEWVAVLAFVGGMVGGAYLGHLFTRGAEDPSHVIITVVPQAGSTLYDGGAVSSNGP